MKKYIIDFFGGKLDILDSKEYEDSDGGYYRYAEYFGMTSDDIHSLQKYLNENYSFLLGISEAWNYFNGD